KVRLTYRNRTGQPSERVVDPWGVVDKDDIWYLLAGTDRGQRTFRVDRIEAAEVTTDTFQWPDGFTLAEAWERVAGEIEQRRTAVWATVLIEPRFVPILRDQFGERASRTIEPGGERASRTIEPGGERASRTIEPGGERAAQDERAARGEGERLRDVEAERGDGRVPVRVGAPTPLDLAR